jgi:uncharacterized phiE125 gp8 family phage protein
MAVWQVHSEPASEPFTVAEMKVYLKVDSTVTTDDDLITAMIRDARMVVERATARALINQSITEYFDEFPPLPPNPKALDSRVLKLYIAPVRIITSVSYIATGGTPSSYTTWNSANYFSDLVSGLNGQGPARICKASGVDWPPIEPYTNAIKVVYDAGYGSAGSNIPGGLREAMRRLIGSWYNFRSGHNDDDMIVKTLIDPYRVHK